MPTAKKERTIEELRARLADAKYLFFTNYAGLSVEDITKLRTELRKDGNSYAVVKNTLFSLAAGDELAERFAQFLSGPTGVIFAPSDPVAPAKALKHFSDTVKPIDVKAAYVDGRVLDAKEVAVLAALPPRAQLQGMLVGLFASPLRNVVGIFAANPGGFARVLRAREQQLAESAS
jgi:large subunit ribosomal protein L10